MEDARSVITIIILIRDLYFNKTDRKRSIMATVEADADLYLGMQRPYQSMGEFYKTFTAQVDTINVNGRSAGFHNVVYNKHMLDLWDRYLVTANLLAAMIPAEKTGLENCLQNEAMDSSCEEYLACVSLLLADKERFKPVTTELIYNYFIRKKEYLANVLAEKRLVTDFDYSNVGKPTSSGKQ